MNAHPTSQAGLLNEMAETLADCARVLAQEKGADPALAAGALGFAMTKILHRHCATDAQRMGAVECMNQSARQAMADMIAGKETRNQVLQ